MASFFRFSLCVLFLASIPAYPANPYDILGVRENASEEEIKKVYLKRVREAHPDVSNLPKEQAEIQFKSIQSAWEQINRLRRSENQNERIARAAENRRAAEREEAKREAAQSLEMQWTQGRFSNQSIRELPRFKASQRPNPLGLEPVRSHRDEGEWEAIEDFFRRHQTEYLENNPSAEELQGLLNSLDVYKELSGQFLQSVRRGFLHPFEKLLLERAHDKNTFLDGFQSQLERMTRAGVFLNSTNPSKEREKALARPAELFAQRFGNTSGNPIGQLAEAAFENTFSKVEKNTLMLHELGPLVRAFSSALPPEEGLRFLGKLIDRLESLPTRRQLSRDFQDLKSKVISEASRIFTKNPDLKEHYQKKTSFWARLSENNSPCDLILGKIAKKLD